jgi:hypothetical protein
MSGFDDLFESFDDIIEEVEPLDDVGKEDVWGKPDSWNSDKQQDIWNNNDGWDTKDEPPVPVDDRKIFKNEPKVVDEDLEWDEQDDDLGIDGF